MKNRIMIFVVILVMAFTMSACNTNKEQPPKPIDTRVMAYRLNEQQLLERQWELAEQFHATNVAVYRDTEGQSFFHVYSAPIEDSENMILPLEEGQYLNRGMYMPKIFPKVWSSEHPLEIEFGGSYAHILPVGEDTYTAEFSRAINMFGQEQDTVLYKDVFGSGIHLRCSATSFGISMEIVLNAQPEQNTFHIRLAIPSVTPDTGSPDYIAFRALTTDTTVRAMLNTPLVADKSNHWSYANAVNLIEKDSENDMYTVKFIIDEEFLSSDTTQYPVTVNQSMHLYKSKQHDTSVYENTGDEASHYLSPYLLLGNSTLKGEGWAYVRYEMLDKLYIDAEKIVSAKYVFRNLFDLPNEAAVGAYAVTEDWCSINTRWDTRPANDENPISQTVVQKAGDYELDITPLFKEMIKNVWKHTSTYSINNSFLIKSDTPGSNMILASGDNGLFSPFLEVIVAE